MKCSGLVNFLSFVLVLCSRHFLFPMESSGSCRPQSRHGTRKGRVLNKSKVLDLLTVNSVQREAFSVSSHCTVVIVFSNCTAARSARVLLVLSLVWGIMLHKHHMSPQDCGSGFLPAFCSSSSISFQKILWMWTVVSS